MNINRTQIQMHELCPFPCSGCSVLPAQSAQWSLSGQYERLGLCWDSVACSGALWPVALHDPGKALHQWPARWYHWQDSSAARHHRDLLHCEQSQCKDSLVTTRTGPVRPSTGIWTVCSDSPSDHTHWKSKAFFWGSNFGGTERGAPTSANQKCC